MQNTKSTPSALQQRSTLATWLAVEIVSHNIALGRLYSAWVVLDRKKPSNPRPTPLGDRYVTSEIKVMSAYLDDERDCCVGGNDCVALVSASFVLR